MCGDALLLRHLARAFQSVDRRERDLLLSLIFASGLAQSLRGFLDVEHVIDYLEGEADVLTELRYRFELFVTGIGVDSTNADAGAEKGSGLGAMDGLQQQRCRAFPFA